MTSGSDALIDRVRELLGHAAQEYSGTDAATRIRATLLRLDEPLRVAIAGRVKAGKSTLLNALIGERVAATDASECTRIVTWYAYGPERVARAYGRGGEVHELSVRTVGSLMTTDVSDLDLATVERIVVELPSERLRHITLIDTPGIASLSEAVGQRTHEFFIGDGGHEGTADAVLYLLRQLHSSDVNFFEAFRDLDLRGTNPVNALGVLSRADEIGGGVPDALEYASVLSAEYRADPRLRSLVQTVVPVAGLLAETASTLDEAEWRLVSAIASIPGALTDPLMLSAHRFTVGLMADVEPAARADLLTRLGLYGVRLAIELVRAGAVEDRSSLAAAVLERSALADLRRLLLSQFADRRDVLKADGAVRVLETILAADTGGGRVALRVHLERVQAGAHELAELRLLNELRSVTSRVPPSVRDDMERLLGGGGMAVTSRLGLAADASAAEIDKSLVAEHGRWQRVAVGLVSSPTEARAAAVLQRTCEGLLGWN